VLATREVLIGQLERYEDLPDEVAALAQVGAPKPDPDAIDAEGKFKWIEGEACFNFGKAKGKRLRDVVATDRGLLDWMLNPERAFSPEVKAIVRNALDGRFPIRT
jgi:DNA polymerase-3 subunit epsilon